MSNPSNASNASKWLADTLHTAANRITRSYQLAEEDARAIGFRENHGRYTDATSRSSSVVCDVCHGKNDECETCAGSGQVSASAVSDPTSTAALREHRAPKWLNDVLRVARELQKLGYVADANWPPTLKPGEEYDGVKIGERANMVEVCEHCGEPVPAIRLASGHSALIRVDGKPYHRNTCYTKLWRAKTAANQ